MQIIRPGKTPDVEKLTHWPEGFSFECPNCTCQYKIQKGDKYEATAERTPGGKQTVKVTCPSCGVENNFTRKQGTTWENGGKP